MTDQHCPYAGKLVAHINEKITEGEAKRVAHELMRAAERLFRHGVRVEYRDARNNEWMFIDVPLNCVPVETPHHSV